MSEEGSRSMSKEMGNISTLRCLCGSVELEATGAPIICAACHCADCLEGSRRLEALPNARPILDSYGGTPYVLYRKDRVKYLKGAQLIKSLKVDDDSPNRAYTTCCNSFMLLDLPNPMHWVPVFRGGFQGKVPSLEMRINAKFKKGSGDFPRDVPTYSSLSLKFVRKLLGSKIAMVFRGT